MQSITVTPGGSGPLVAYQLRVMGAPNSAPVAHMVTGIVGTTPQSSTRLRAGMSGLLSVDSTGSHSWVSAYKCSNGLWSENSTPSSQAFSNYGGGSVESSIGSGNTSDLRIQNPGFLFPDLTNGSGKMITRRVLVSDGPFQTEMQGETYKRSRATFHCILQNIDASQSSVLHKFFSALGGPLVPFYFDWVPPERGSLTSGSALRYLVRFRDISVASQLHDVVWSNASFYLIEALGDAEEDS